MTSAHVWLLARKGDEVGLEKVTMDLDAQVVTVIIDVTTNADGTAQLRDDVPEDGVGSKEVDFRAKAVSLSDSLCALLMRALTSRKVLHLLLHGCNSIKMWSKVESKCRSALLRVRTWKRIRQKCMAA